MFAQRAQAYIIVPMSGNCTVDTLNIPTVTIGDIFNIPPITATVSFSCSPKDPALRPTKPGQYMAYCWHIHNGGGGKDYNTYGYRGAVNGNNVIWFNFYGNQPNLGSEPVGTIERPYNIYGRAKQTGTNTWSVQDTVTLQFEHNDSAANLPAGHYIYNNPMLHVGMTMLNANDPFNKLYACGGGDTNDSSNSNAIGSGTPFGNAHVDLNIDTYCHIEPGVVMDFGKQFKLDHPLTTYVNIHMDCTGGTDFTVTVGQGDHYDNALRTRRMELQANLPNVNMPLYINYSLDPEEFHGRGTGTGMDNSPAYTIKGTVPMQITPPAGVYKDTVVLTASYWNAPPDKPIPPSR